ncbi:acetyltransferase [Oscillatoria sp. FACHB-1406]|uniref:acetyltransferase n=1 Tax=Oscillatoria sp. FACHB-1406 TaxID=2692846 RepID=UPI0016855EFA|nr:acetyltransferase [Oscillatoria sp. FACHB-1406]MBD2580546.1 acetyltransferase [Oscillatoria sp. FACHB-1406]
MFVKQKSTGNLIEVWATDELCDPNQSRIEGQMHAGEELQEPEKYEKSDLIFPSGESLPQCWVDTDYRD